MNWPAQISLLVILTAPALSVAGVTVSISADETGPTITQYQVIADRNMFDLQPAPPPSPGPPLSSPPPKEDLQLTGLCDLFSIRSASFKIVVAGQPSACFTLTEGAQNEWLEVLSVSLSDHTAKIRIKKPFIRIRSLGVEVLLRFHARKEFNCGTLS